MTPRNDFHYARWWTDNTDPCGRLPSISFLLSFSQSDELYGFARFVPHASQQIGPLTLLILLCLFLSVSFACDSELNQPRIPTMMAKPRLSCACEYGSNLGLGNRSLPCRSEAANGGCRHLRIVNDWVLCAVRTLEGHMVFRKGSYHAIFV